MIKRSAPLAFLLAAAVLFPGARGAQAAAKNPCADASSLQNRSDILDAVPAADTVWRQILERRGIYKNDGGQWMQSFVGGEATASNQAFVAAFSDYCAARAAAASTGKPAAAKSNLPDWAVAANKKNEARTSKEVEAQLRAYERASAVAVSMSGAALPAAQAAPVSTALQDPCAVCGDVGSCKDAGISGGTTPTDFFCAHARAQAAAAHCSCR